MSSSPIDRAPSIWRPCRIAATVVMLLCGGLVAVFSLGVREYASGYWWGSNRYGNWGWQFVDFALALIAGTVFFPRAAWLAMSALARLSGHDLPGGHLKTHDFWTLVVPGTLLAYLVYVANVRNVSFWPFGLVLLGAYVLLKRVSLRKEQRPMVALGQDDRSRQ